MARGRKPIVPQTPEIKKVVRELPHIDEEPYVPTYSSLLEFSIHDIGVPELRRYLRRYCDDYNRPGWNNELLDKLDGECSKVALGQIEKVCESLDRLCSVARFLFSKFAFRKRAFASVGVVRLGYPERFQSQLDDSVLMVTFVERLTTELQRWREGDDGRVYKANVLYTRQPGLAVFSIDRYDTSVMSAHPETCLIYIVDDIPSMFVVPYLIPVKVILASLQASLGWRMLPHYGDKSALLYQVITDEASRLGLRRDNFPDYLKELLHFQANTLRRLVRDPALVKYPAEHSCPFKDVNLEVTDGLKLVVKSKRRANLLEVLYEMEKNNEICLPQKVIEVLARGETNSFKAFELL